MNRFLKRLDQAAQMARELGPCTHKRATSDHAPDDVDAALAAFFAACAVCGWQPTWVQLVEMASDQATV